MLSAPGARPFPASPHPMAPFLFWSPPFRPCLAKTEFLKHVVALPALWGRAEARLCKAQGRAPSQGQG